MPDPSVKGFRRDESSMGTWELQVGMPRDSSEAWDYGISLQLFPLPSPEGLLRSFLLLSPKCHKVAL